MRTLFTTLIVVLFSTMAMAQLPVNVGIKAGANYSIVNADDFAGFGSENAASFLGGAFFRLKIKGWSGQVEALYVTKTGSLTNDLLGDNDVQFATLDIPVLLGREIVDLKLLKLRALAGVVQSIHLGDNGDLNEDGYTDGYTSIAVGASLDITKILVDLRYQHALGDFYEFAGASLSNNMITLSVGFKIL